MRGSMIFLYPLLVAIRITDQHRIAIQTSSVFDVGPLGRSDLVEDVGRGLVVE